MPTLPSRKSIKLWSSGTTKGPPSPKTEIASTEEGQDPSEDASIKETLQQSQQRLKQLLQEKEKGGEGLAADINLRRKTNERLYVAVEAYWSSLSKVKALPFEMNATSALEIAMTLDEAKAACNSRYSTSSHLVLQAAEDGSSSITNRKERTLPVEALGIAMASCANTYSRSQEETAEDKLQLQKNEVYASHLAHLSAVHLALAQLQADYTTSLSSTFLNRLARSQAAIEALKSTEKQTEAAREKMEAAEKKRDKARDKGEKNRRDMEEEARMARATYEEALADLQTRTEILRESEQKGPSSGVAMLKEYMDVHLAWVEAQHDVLAKARSALDHYPTNQSNSVSNSPVLKNRAAPPPPPLSQLTTARRVVEPPPSMPRREEQRQRSVSSPNTHKPKLASRSSLNDVLSKVSRASKEEDRSQQRPSSRNGASIPESAPRSIMSRIPFVRSESYSPSNSSNDGLGAEGNAKKGRMGAIGASLGRSSSSLGLNNSDASKTTPSTTGGTGTDFSGSEKGNSWAGNLLSRKKDSKKDGTYQAMMSDDQNQTDHERRGLSHVQEGSTESRLGTEDILFIQHRNPSITYNTDQGHRDELSMLTRKQEPYSPVSPSHLQAWEKFEQRRDSLGIGSHLTGNTVSSEGSNPFGPDGGELSPMGTGNSPFTQIVKGSWGQNVGEEDDAADGLLGSKNDGTIRKFTRK